MKFFFLFFLSELIKFFFQEKQLKKIASLLADDIFYKDTNKDYIYDDLLFLSDYDIHKLALEHTVSYKMLSHV